jgi:CheY-like chemotaxis protein/two-component sensor histidine kinase
VAARGLAAIHRSAEAQRRLVDDLLDVSRMATSQLRIGSETVDVTRAVEAAVDSLRPDANDRKVTLAFSPPAGPIVVHGDADRLQQVVRNLVSNAVKFTPAGGSARVTLESSSTTAKLTVADTGIGISRELLPRIFEWFGQGDTARTRRYSGLGLGLGIVKQLVQLHHGEVYAESDGQGRGATFVVTLPLALTPAGLAAPPTQHDAPAAPPSRSLKNVSVLLVEDDEETREVVRMALERAGAHVTAASSAPQARRVFSDAHPDVLVSDIAMPDEDGYSLIRSLRAEGRRVPAIALTAFASKEDEAESLEAGFQIHIAKPVAPAQLIDTIAELATA